MDRELLYNGSFYPSKLDEILNFINSYQIKNSVQNRIVGYILPHAGWIYSGKVTLKALSYKPVFPVKNIILLGPSHRVGFTGAAVCSFNKYLTVNSSFNINTELRNELLNIKNVTINNKAHSLEHSLEVQLEFLKYLYPNSKLLPVVVGNNSILSVENILKTVINIKNSIIIISSDLSHYIPYKQAN